MPGQRQALYHPRAQADQDAHSKHAPVPIIQSLARKRSDCVGLLFFKVFTTLAAHCNRAIISFPCPLRFPRLRA